MDSFFQDARYALRVLRKSPGFALAAVLALALGIGANSAVFSVVNGVLLRPLPFAEPERLVRLFGNFRGNGLERISVSVPEYRDYRELPRALASVAAYVQVDVTLTGQDVPERLRALAATPSLLSTLGVTPTLGRHFDEQEQASGQDRVLLLTHRLWRGRFGANPHILGTTLSLDGLPYTVVGVLPEGFEYPRGTDLYFPLALTGNPLVPDSRGTRFLDVVARLKPGVAPRAAQQDMERVAAELRQLHPGNYAGNSGWAISVVSMEEQTVGGVRTTLWVLLGAVGFVLLIACTNVANLLLIFAGVAVVLASLGIYGVIAYTVTQRTHELGIRMALGASQTDILALMVGQGLRMTLVGVGIGLALALGLGRLLSTLLYGIQAHDPLTFVAVAALLVGVALVASWLPARRAARVDPAVTLRAE